MRLVLIPWIATGVLAGVSACFDPPLADGAIACGSAGCPEGMRCAFDGFCYRDPPVSPDAGGAPDAGGPPDPGAPDEVDARDDGSGPPAPCPPDESIDYCDAIPALPEAPAIDGELDCGIPLEMVEPIGWTGPGPGVPEGQQAAVALGWRPDGLYVFVLVVDPTVLPAAPGAAPWKGDGVEIYADDDGSFAAPPAYDDPGTRQLAVAAPPEGQEREVRGTSYVDAELDGPWTSDAYAAYSTPTGYVVEAFLGAPDLGLPSWTPSADTRVGFDLAINVSTDSRIDGEDGTRLGQYYLRVAADGGAPYESVDAFCRPELLGPTPGPM